MFEQTVKLQFLHLLFRKFLFVPIDLLLIAVLLGKNAAAILLQAMINVGADMDIDIGKNIELGYMAACFGTPDQIEGFTAFKEKRAAKFR